MNVHYYTKHVPPLTTQRITKCLTTSKKKNIARLIRTQDIVEPVTLATYKRLPKTSSGFAMICFKVKPMIARQMIK